jgi:cell division protein FtsL
MTATLPARRTAPAPAPAPARRPDGTRRTAERRLEVVRPAPRPRTRRRLLTCLAVLTVAGALFGVVGVHVLLTEGQLSLDKLEARAVEEQGRYERLRLKVAELESPARVTAVAQRRLGMVPPPGVTYLSPSGATTDPLASASADDSGDAWPVVKARLADRP